MRTRSQAKTPAEVAPVVCPNKACGITLSASLVKRTGKCLRCGAAVEAPPGTLDTDAARFAAEHAAKTQAAVPLGQRTQGELRPSTAPLVPRNTAGTRADVTVVVADDFGPSVADEEVTHAVDTGAMDALAEEYDDDDPFSEPEAAPPPVTETRVSVPSLSLQARADLDQAAFAASEKLPIHVAPRSTEPGAPLESVTVAWGEELLSPVQYNTLKVGPFSATVQVMAGETREQALVRAYASLQAFAEKERERKIASYLAALKATRARG